MSPESVYEKSRREKEQADQVTYRILKERVEPKHLVYEISRTFQVGLTKAYQLKYLLEHPRYPLTEEELKEAIEQRKES
jgi:hypothetical protein